MEVGICIGVDCYDVVPRASQKARRGCGERGLSCSAFPGYRELHWLGVFFQGRRQEISSRPQLVNGNCHLGVAILGQSINSAIGAIV